MWCNEKQYDTAKETQTRGRFDNLRNFCFQSIHSSGNLLIEVSHACCYTFHLRGNASLDSSFFFKNQACCVSEENKRKTLKSFVISAFWSE